MGKKYTLEKHEAYVEAEEKRKDAEETARRERMEKTAAQKAWVADGGNAADFEEAWPTLRDGSRAMRVADADQRAREAQRQNTLSNF